MVEAPGEAPRAEMFELPTATREAADAPETLLIGFEQGLPVSVNGERLGPAALLRRLNEAGGRHGVGRIDMVESRYVGMKSRGVYETPGGTILHIAHRAMESITLDRGVINLKDTLMPRFAQLVYNGYWFSPEMEVLLSMVRETQRPVPGAVRRDLGQPIHVKPILQLVSRQGLEHGLPIRQSHDGNGWRRVLEGVKEVWRMGGENNL